MPLAQLVVAPNLLVTMCSPGHAIDGEEIAVARGRRTSLRGFPLIVPSIRIGVCAESQSCVSCGDVWKYQAIFPVSTLTATSEQVKRLSPLPADAGVARRRVAGAEDVELRFGIVDARESRPGRRHAAPRSGSATCRGPDRRASSARCRTSTAACRFPDRRTAGIPACRGRCRCRRARDRRSTIGAIVEKYCFLEARRSRRASAPCRFSHRARPDSCPASRSTGSCCHIADAAVADVCAALASSSSSATARGRRARRAPRRCRARVT